MNRPNANANQPNEIKYRISCQGVLYGLAIANYELWIMSGHYCSVYSDSNGTAAIDSYSFLPLFNWNQIIFIQCVFFTWFVRLCTNFGIIINMQIMKIDWIK